MSTLAISIQMGRKSRSTKGHYFEVRVRNRSITFLSSTINRSIRLRGTTRKWTNRRNGSFDQRRKTWRPTQSRPRMRNLTFVIARRWAPNNQVELLHSTVVDLPLHVEFPLGASLLQKAGKAEKALSNQLPHRRALTKEASSELVKPTKKRSGKQPTESDEDQDPLNVNVTVLVKNYTGKDDDQAPSARNTPGKHKELESNAPRLPKASAEFERTALSDTEQIMTEKQKKRRRPKRISRTTQTYERIFRMMAFEEHEELRPTGKTEKCIQTRRSQLRPRTKSPRKQPPIYLSADAFKSVDDCFAIAELS